MKARLFSLLALAALIFVAGCERADVGVFTVEGDEPGYRRGKDLIKQGRNQEALSEFLKVIDKRGLNNAPESHLEVGLLYQFHMKDPIAAIFHYKKFRELKPNSPQSDLVRQRIDAATRDFAKNILGNPLEKDIDRLTSDDVAKRLLFENDRLKAEIAALRAGKIVAEREAETAAADAAATPPTQPGRSSPVASEEESPVENVAASNVSPVSPVTPTVSVRPPQPSVTQPVRPPQQTTTRPPQQVTNSNARPTTPSSTNTNRSPSGPYRKHVVAKDDTLYSLSLKYYGTRARWKDIYAANRDVMKTPEDYKAGMVLKIPQ